MSDTIWIVRHGNRSDFMNPDWAKTAERPDDPDLSPDGVEQAMDTGRRLAGEGIAHCFASPFYRTVQTAAHIAEACGLSVRLEEGLAEWLNPEWFDRSPVRLSYADLARDFPVIDLTYEDAGRAVYPETEEQALDRAGAAARALAEAWEGSLLLVGHGASVCGMVWGLVGERVELHAGLCCVLKLERTDGAWQLVIPGDDSHLRTTEEEIRFI